MLTLKQAVEKFQCVGCVSGSDTECGAFKQDGLGGGCSSHAPGTLVYPGIGKIFLGLPKGFHRVGPDKDLKLIIFENKKEMVCWNYDAFNVPVWKTKYEGAVIVRGFQPRTNRGFLHVILDEAFFDDASLKRAITIGPEAIDGMD